MILSIRGNVVEIPVAIDRSRYHCQHQTAGTMSAIDDGSVCATARYLDDRQEILNPTACHVIFKPLILEQPALQNFTIRRRKDR